MASTYLWRSWVPRVEWNADVTVPQDVRDRLAAFYGVCSADPRPPVRHDGRSPRGVRSSTRIAENENGRRGSRTRNARESSTMYPPSGRAHSRTSARLGLSFDGGPNRDRADRRGRGHDFPFQSHLPRRHSTTHHRRSRVSVVHPGTDRDRCIECESHETSCVHTTI
jgi:hypothetical protein